MFYLIIPIWKECFTYFWQHCSRRSCGLQSSGSPGLCSVRGRDRAQGTGEHWGFPPMPGFQQGTFRFYFPPPSFHIRFPKGLSVPSPKPRHLWAAGPKGKYQSPHPGVFPGGLYTPSQWWNLQEFGGKSPELWWQSGLWEWAMTVEISSEPLQSSPREKNMQSSLSLSGLGHVVGERMSIHNTCLAFLLFLGLLLVW